jgi:hypothetical protein
MMVRMQLHYLDFDFSDEDSGRGSFDAVAAVAAGRVPAVLEEINLVLAWACRVFGPVATPDNSGASDDSDEWNYQVQAFAAGHVLDMCRDGSGRVGIRSAVPHDALTELTFTLSGSSAFCEAFRQEFRAAE